MCVTPKKNKIQAVYVFFVLVIPSVSNKIEMLFLYLSYYSSRLISEQMTSTTDADKLTVTKHIPGIKLTNEERAEKCAKHKLGLCCSCDAGFDHRCDYILYPALGHDGLFVSMCVPCVDYYGETGKTFDFDKL